MLEKQLKKWNGKKVKLSYVYKDQDGNIYCPIKQFEELKKDIVKQGFTFTETEKTIEIDGTNQFFWKPRGVDPIIGLFNARTTKYELLEGNKILINGSYPTKKDIIDYGEDFFIKQGRGCEILYKLV